MKGPFAVVLLIASSFVGVSWVGAQDPAKEAAPKAQDDPAPAKKAADVTPPAPFPIGYLDHQGLSDALKRAAEAHPEVVRVDSLAKSKEGRDVWIASIHPAAKGEPARPSILLVANLEADHVVGSEVALGLVEKLAAMDGKGLEGRTIYVVPRLNPDGAERLLKATPKADLRANLTAIDRDRDGKANEDGPNDLDGDGLALAMRRKDAKATLIPDAKDPRLLKKADLAKGEKPVYSESTEGVDDDGDGSIDEDPVGGVNLNRNWPHGWTEYTPETGTYATSEPEVEGLIRFAFAHPELVAVWSFGLNDNLKGDPKTLPADAPHLLEIIKAYAASTASKGDTPKDEPKAEPAKDEAKKAEAPPADAPKAKAKGKAQGKGQGRAGGGGGGAGGAGAAATPPPASPAPTLEGTTDGALSEWAYQQFGVVGIASRLWARPEAAPGAPPLAGEGDARWLDWNDKVMGGSAFVPFHPVDHPTLGKVEVGGWKPGVRLNPPADQVAALVEGHFAFLKDLAGRLPSLAIKDVKVEAKGGGIFEVKATIENPGTLPTALAQGVTTRKAAPVLVKLLDLGDAKLLSGKALNRINALAGMGGTQDYRWLVLVPEGKKTLTIEASCPKAGTARREVTLP